MSAKLTGEVRIAPCGWFRKRLVLQVEEYTVHFSKFSNDGTFRRHRWRDARPLEISGYQEEKVKINITATLHAPA